MGGGETGGCVGGGEGKGLGGGYEGGERGGDGSDGGLGGGGGHVPVVSHRSPEYPHAHCLSGCAGLSSIRSTQFNSFFQCICTPFTRPSIRTWLLAASTETTLCV